MDKCFLTLHENVPHKREEGNHLSEKKNQSLVQKVFYFWLEKNLKNAKTKNYKNNTETNSVNE